MAQARPQVKRAVRVEMPPARGLELEDLSRGNFVANFVATFVDPTAFDESRRA